MRHFLELDRLSRAGWLLARKQGIGSSDAPAICGFDRFRSPYVVWLDKTGAIGSDEGNAATEWGNRLEAVVAEKFAEDHPGLIVDTPRWMVQHDAHDWMLASPDRWCDDAEFGEPIGLLEIKTTGQYRADDWRDGAIPQRVQIQVQHQLAVTGLAKAWVAVLIGGRDYRAVEVERDDAAIEAIIAIESAFWHDHVLPMIPPAIDGAQSTSDAIRDLYALVKPDAEIVLPDAAREVIHEWRAAKKLLSEAQDDVAKWDNELRVMMAENEVGYLDGDVAVTLREVATTRVDMKRLKAEHPDIAEVCSSMSTYRRLVVKS